MPLSSLRLLIGALLTATAASALTVPVAASGATTPTAPVAPAAQSCHALSVEESVAMSDPDPAVPCETRHSSRTFRVVTLPDGVDPRDADAMSEVASDRCSPVYRRLVSRSMGKRLLSAFSYVWFAPTRREVDLGARWIRCDLILLGGRGLAPLPKARIPALSSTTANPDHVARCYTGPRGGYSVTVCSRPHQYRARSVYTMRTGDYPTEAQVQRAGARWCGSSDGVRRASFRPTPEQWRGGFRYFVCTVVTTR